MWFLRCCLIHFPWLRNRLISAKQSYKCMMVTKLHPKEKPVLFLWVQRKAHSVGVFISRARLATHSWPKVLSWTWTGTEDLQLQRRELRERICWRLWRPWRDKRCPAQNKNWSQRQPSYTPPRRVPVSLRELLKEELQRMEKLGVRMKATEPTSRVHSLVIAKKKNNKLRVCLDPSDLNWAAMREHFPMQTIEDVISRMPNAKVFSVCPGCQLWFPAS